MRVSSIPPKTSTGSNRKPTSAPLDGLAHMSIGRYMSEKRSRANSEEDNDNSWDIKKYAKSDFNKKSGKKIVTPIIFETPQIKSITDIFHNYNEEGDLAIIIEFKAFEFIGSTFNNGDSNNNTCNYFIPISYEEKTSHLYLNTTGDIFEFKICNTEDECLYSDEICVPELLHDYNSLSMSITQKNNWVIVTYKKTL